MGKKSRAKNPWIKKPSELHTFSDIIPNPLGRLFHVLSRGLTRPSKAELEKQLKERRL